MAELPLAIGTNIRFNEAFLARQSDLESRRYRGRVGVVSGYRAGANEPIVEFTKFGLFKAHKLFEVQLKWIEVLVEPAAESSIPSSSVITNRDAAS